MTESALHPLNDAERLIQVVRAMPPEEWRELVADLTDVELIDWLNALSEISPPVWNRIWRQVQDAKTPPNP